MKRFIKDESGLAAVEYGLIACLIAVALVASVSLVGKRLDGVYNKVAASLRVPAAPVPCSAHDVKDCRN
jgi:pilus assembly protein Flp/PilA